MKPAYGSIPKNKNIQEKASGPFGPKAFCNYPVITTPHPRALQQERLRILQQ